RASWLMAWLPSGWGQSACWWSSGDVAGLEAHHQVDQVVQRQRLTRVGLERLRGDLDLLGSDQGTEEGDHRVVGRVPDVGPAVGADEVVVGLSGTGQHQP